MPRERRRAIPPFYRSARVSGTPLKDTPMNSSNHLELPCVASGNLMPKQDHGFDHHERDAAGKVVSWRLVPSGRIVDADGLKAWQATRTKRDVQNECLGMSWDEIERRQGGKLRRNA